MADLRFTKCGLGITAAIILALSLLSFAEDGRRVPLLSVAPFL